MRYQEKGTWGLGEVLLGTRGLGEVSGDRDEGDG